VSRAATLALLALPVVAMGCGYRLAGTSSNLPPHIRTIAVVPFENRTERPEIEQRVTEAVARELSRRGKYQVITDRSLADAVLEGVVTSYRTVPVEFNEEGRESRAEATLMIQASLRDNRSDEVLWNQSGLVFREQFDVTEEPQSGEYFDRETIALDALARGVAGALATSMFEGF
jgi:TolB-like protein